MSEPGTIDPHKTKFSASLAVGWTMAVALVAGTAISAARLTNIDRDIGELKKQRVFTTEDINKMVDDRVDALWQRRRPTIRLTCGLFPSRGVFGDCREVGP